MATADQLNDVAKKIHSMVMDHLELECWRRLEAGESLFDVERTTVQMCNCTGILNRRKRDAFWVWLDFVGDADGVLSDVRVKTSREPRCPHMKADIDWSPQLVGLPDEPDDKDE